MTTLREAAQRALDALYDIDAAGVPVGHIDLVIDTLRAALEQTEQEPEPRREWQSLTDEEIAAALPHEPGDLDFVCARAIEAALKEKNHG
jgi:hypothetical protein